jgi:O-antigen/teichoic acid export membrane protein
MVQSTVKVLNRVREQLCLGNLNAADPRARASERHRRATLTGAAAILAKIVNVATGLVTIPMTLHYLGPERFGLWMTINAVVAILAFADFGIGNGVLNAVSEAWGKDDLCAVRSCVENGLVLLSFVAILGLAVFFSTYSFTNWAAIFNVHSPVAAVEAGPAMAVFVVCFACNLPLGVIQRVQLGLQEGFLSTLWQLFGSVAGLLGVLAVIHARGGLPWLVAALAGAPVVASVLNSALFFGVLRPALRPSLSLLSLTSMGKIAKLGALFFVLQLAVAMAFSSDNLIVARVLGAEAVATYAITAKMFSMISVVIAMFVGPLWPAYGEAISRGDTHWVKRTLFRSMAVAATVAAVAALLIVFEGTWILRHWLGRDLQPPFLLLLGLGLWTVMEVAGNALAMFLNGANVVGVQVVIASIFAATCLGAKIIVIRKLGLVGVPWATFCTYVVVVAVPYSLLLPRLLAVWHTKAIPAPEPEWALSHVQD